MSATLHATKPSPATITAAWKRSVRATDHMPPAIVYASTMPAPRTIPVRMSIAPALNTLNARPSATNCAAIQPRYDNAIESESSTSETRS